MQRQTLAELAAVLQEAAETGRPIEEQYLHEGGWTLMADCMFDLDNNTYRVQPEPRKPREVWVSRYGDLGCYVFNNPDDAEQLATPNRTECVHFREVLPEEE